jgi:predicted amidohydrolase
MATRNGSKYVLKEDMLGTLEVGKLADIVVLDQDFLTMPEDKIGEITPQMTVFDGNIVFVHPKFSQEYNLRPPGAVISTTEELRSRGRGEGAGGG